MDKIINTVLSLETCFANTVPVTYLFFSFRRILNGCSDALNPQLLGMALLGLRGASSSVAEVVAVLAALTPKVS